jgi:hypothetical protein
MSSIIVNHTICSWSQCSKNLPLLLYEIPVNEFQIEWKIILIKAVFTIVCVQLILTKNQSFAKQIQELGIIRCLNIMTKI